MQHPLLCRVCHLWPYVTLCVQRARVAFLPATPVICCVLLMLAAATRTQNEALLAAKVELRSEIAAAVKESGSAAAVVCALLGT